MVHELARLDVNVPINVAWEGKSGLAQEREGGGKRTKLACAVLMILIN
jgi:hypothetical protein